MLNHTGRGPARKGASRGSVFSRLKEQAENPIPQMAGVGSVDKLPSESADGRLEPKDLIRRAERMLWTSETVATRALDGDDSRLVLLALDRVKSALETLMKAHGMLGPDISVNIDNRSINTFAGWPTASLQALTEFAAALESGGSASRCV